MVKRHCRHGAEHGDRRFARDEFGFRGRGFGRGHHHMRGGRLGRVFDQGDLRFVMLRLIAEKPRHGYEIIKAIEEKLGGVYSPSPGVIYPTLTLLEELGYVTVQDSGGGKKLYAVTAEGTAFLDANRAAVDAIFGRMDAVAAAQGGGPAPQILRAMENLKLALRLRLSRGPLSEAQIAAVAAALDGAAQAVEQS
ncbi:MAG TPA: PadR family transcriptional regulator [Alphaproteobacteria bacterium]|jgi:DNA-binding PadR family transcriptional regulator|nr:PadR family transcriptional regulator [Alphaproteobacteria bacterium]